MKIFLILFCVITVIQVEEKVERMMPCVFLFVLYLGRTKEKEAVREYEYVLGRSYEVKKLQVFKEFYNLLYMGSYQIV